NRVLARLSTLAEAPPMTASDRVLVLDSSAAPAPLVPAAPPPQGAVLHPPEPAPDPARRKWLLTQLFSEIRFMFRMYFDPRYRISRTTQFLLPVILGLLVLNYFFFAVWVDILFISPVAERLLAVFLGVLGYK